MEYVTSIFPTLKRVIQAGNTMHYRPLQKRERTGKEYVCFSIKFESLYHDLKNLEKENGKMVALQISPKIEFVWIG